MAKSVEQKREEYEVSLGKSPAQVDKSKYQSILTVTIPASLTREKEELQFNTYEELDRHFRQQNPMQLSALKEFFNGYIHFENLGSSLQWKFI